MVAVWPVAKGRRCRSAVSRPRPNILWVVAGGGGDKKVGKSGWAVGCWAGGAAARAAGRDGGRRWEGECICD